MRRFKGYIADHNGRTQGNDGHWIAYAKGVLILAKEGELDHVGPGMVPVYEEEAGGVSPAVPEAVTASISSSDVETRPVKASTRKRKATSTAKK